jgi:hypothetical protein
MLLLLEIGEELLHPGRRLGSGFSSGSGLDSIVLEVRQRLEHVSGSRATQGKEERRSISGLS